MPIPMTAQGESQLAFWDALRGDPNLSPSSRGETMGLWVYGHLLIITGYKWDYTIYKWGYKYL